MSDVPREYVEELIRKSGMSLHLGMPHEAVVEQMTRFASLVRNETLEAAEHAIQCAMEFEREQCAKVCEVERERLLEWGHGIQVITADKLAKAIQERGDK